MKGMDMVNAIHKSLQKIFGQKRRNDVGFSSVYKIAKRVVIADQTLMKT